MVLLMTMGLVQPEHVIALRKIPSCTGSRPNGGGGLTIGALATHRQLELAPEVRAYAPALERDVRARRHGAHPQPGDARRQPRPRRPGPGSAADADRSRRVGDAAEPDGRAAPAGRGAVRRLPDHPASAGRSADRRSPSPARAWNARHLSEVPAANAGRLRHGVGGGRAAPRRRRSLRARPRRAGRRRRRCRCGHASSRMRWSASS